MQAFYWLYNIIYRECQGKNRQVFSCKSIRTEI